MPDLTFWGILWFLVTGAVGAVMWAAQIGPEQASSNLAQWAKKAGFHHVPPWLRTRAADRWVLRWGKVALLILGLLGLVGMLKLTTLTIPVTGMIVCAIGLVGFSIAWLLNSERSAQLAPADNGSMEFKS